MTDQTKTQQINELKEQVAELKAARTEELLAQAEERKQNERRVAAKAVAFREALSPSFIHYQKRVIENSKTMANLFNKLGYKIISNGTDNHLMLIDLRNKNISGKDAEEALVKAEITVNKNMVPFDDKSPFVTSGIRIGTPAITTRGFVKNEINVIVNMIDKVLNNHKNMSVINKVADDVKQIMKERKLFNF